MTRLRGYTAWENAAMTLRLRQEDPMSDRAWRQLANHLQRQAEDRAAVEARIRELAAKYEVPWEDVQRSLDRATR
jgi:DNA-directed RNA polymerase specialized sigma subunit